MCKSCAMQTTNWFVWFAWPSVNIALDLELFASDSVRAVPKPAQTLPAHFYGPTAFGPAICIAF